MNDVIKNFYLDISEDDAPTFTEVIESDHNWIESTHNWCQRAFPNFEQSEIVADAPILDDQTLIWLKATCLPKVYELTHRYLVHYGQIDPTSVHMAHNNRRVTRLIKYLIMLECDNLAYVVFNYCIMHSKIDQGEPNTYNQVMTKTYWEEAFEYTKPKEITYLS